MVEILTIISLFSHNCRGPPQPAGLIDGPVLGLGNPAAIDLGDLPDLEQVDVLVMGHHQMDASVGPGQADEESTDGNVPNLHVERAQAEYIDVEEVGQFEDFPAEVGVERGQTEDMHEATANADEDSLESTVPPLRINVRNLTIQRVSPVRIDLRRVPPLRIRRLDLEPEVPVEDADVSIVHGDDTVELIPGTSTSNLQ